MPGLLEECGNLFNSVPMGPLWFPFACKAAIPGKPAKHRVSGDCSITINHQLEAHRHPMPLPEDLMWKLSGGYGFTKVDLADTYNQIMLAAISQSAWLSAPIERYCFKCDFHLALARPLAIFGRSWTS